MASLALEREIAPAESTVVREAARAARRTRKAAGCSMPQRDRQTLIASLYAEYGPGLLAYANRMLHDTYQAEDVVQETMMRAWRHAERLTPEYGSVPAWLTRVAHNITIDKIRRLARTGQTAETAETVETAAAPDVFDDHSTRVVQSIYIACVLNRLSPAHREALQHVYFSDRTIPETARIVGVPVGTVKSRVYHALRQLRLYLDE